MCHGKGILIIEIFRADVEWGKQGPVGIQVDTVCYLQLLYKQQLQLLLCMPWDARSVVTFL